MLRGKKIKYDNSFIHKVIKINFKMSNLIFSKKIKMLQEQFLIQLVEEQIKILKINMSLGRKFLELVPKEEFLINRVY
jgi:hypothetical protein